jgi:hypothetical protein
MNNDIGAGRSGEAENKRGEKIKTTHTSGPFETKLVEAPAAKRPPPS